MIFRLINGRGQSVLAHWRILWLKVFTRCAAGKTLGMSDRRIFWTVVMPTAGPGIASGTVLAFARAIGEYGATSMLAGNILGKTRTVSVAIASETAAGNYGMAGFWVVVILIISFVIVAAINIVSGKGMKMGRWM